MCVREYVQAFASEYVKGGLEGIGNLILYDVCVYMRTHVYSEIVCHVAERATCTTGLD